MTGTNLLAVRIIYGCGLRLAECVNLRVKDIDFERDAVIVRSGKGDKDRETVLPASIKNDLNQHLKKIRLLYEEDRKSNARGVMIPGALERKYPNAGKEWPWFWVFPSCKHSWKPTLSAMSRRGIGSLDCSKKSTTDAGTLFSSGIHFAGGDQGTYKRQSEGWLSCPVSCRCRS